MINKDIIIEIHGQRGVDVDRRYPGYYLSGMPNGYGSFPMRKSFELAEAYIPFQWYTTSLSPMEALSRDHVSRAGKAV